MPGEGASLSSAKLMLHPSGDFMARVVVLWTDSGTVERASEAKGQWNVRGDSLVLTYRAVDAIAWCPLSCADMVQADVGYFDQTGLSIRRLVGLGPQNLGAEHSLHFQRVTEH